MAFTSEPYPKPKGGRPSLFGPKSTARVQAVLTVTGSVRFEATRTRVANLIGKEAEQVSDADVIEFLVRGEKEALAILQPKTEKK